MRSGLLAIAFMLTGAQVALAQREYVIPLFISDREADLYVSDRDRQQEGFVRVINHSERSGTVSIVAIDDDDNRSAPIRLELDSKATAHFNSKDLERGNPAKGLSGDIAHNGTGDWRLELTTDLDIQPSAYVRTKDGFLTGMHGFAPRTEQLEGKLYHVPIFNPGSNTNQQSQLRLVNPNRTDVDVKIFGRDDQGVMPVGVSLGLRGGEAVTLTAQELESGGRGIAGGLGNGAGKWQLFVIASYRIVVMSLLESVDGNLTNLSGRAASGEQIVPLFIPASNLVQESFVRVTNHSELPGEISVFATDDSGRRVGPLTIPLDALQTLNFNSQDLATGNPSKGMSQGVGSGDGDWRLEISSDLVIETRAYVRTEEGFLTAMNDVAHYAEAGGRHHVPVFNPGSNTDQRSRLRLINSYDQDIEVKITGVDDGGASSVGEVRLTLPAGAARTLTAQELESGGSDFSGSLGDGEGKWQLFVSIDQPIVVSTERPFMVMSLLESAGGKLTNLSRTSYLGPLFGALYAGSYQFRAEETETAGEDVASAGDVDGDGLTDLMVASSGHTTEEIVHKGAVYLIAGAALAPADAADGVIDGVVHLRNAASQDGSFKLVGEENFDHAGLSLAPAGDIDGDGLADLIVAAPGHDVDDDLDNGAVYLLSGIALSPADAADGTADGVVDLGNVAAQEGAWKLVGEEEYSSAGRSVASAGDIDGDGLAEVMVGAESPSDDEIRDRGVVYLLSGTELSLADVADGTADGVIDLGNVAMQRGSWKLVGEQEDSYMGDSVSSAGDVHGDGVADIIVGAFGLQVDGDYERGAAYLVSGAALSPADAADGTMDGVIRLANAIAEEGSWKFVGERAYDWAGDSVSLAGDIDDDGLGDLIIGGQADNYDVGYQVEGAAYLVSGVDLAALDAADGAADSVIELGNVPKGNFSWKLVGERDNDRVGDSVAPVGDVNGDGRAEFIVGARSSQYRNQAAYVVSGADLAALDRADGYADGVIRVARIGRK